MFSESITSHCGPRCSRTLVKSIRMHPRMLQEAATEDGLTCPYCFSSTWVFGAFLMTLKWPWCNYYSLREIPLCSDKIRREKVTSHKLFALFLTSREDGQTEVDHIGRRASQSLAFCNWLKSKVELALSSFSWHVFLKVLQKILEAAVEEKP